MARTWKDSARVGQEPHPNLKPQRRKEREERELRRELEAEKCASA